jgi:hypothetical protein
MPTSMTALEQAKAARVLAHERFQSRLLQVQEDLSARSVGGRIADRAAEAVDQAVDVAKDSKGVIAGTIAALVLWFFRHPIMDRITRDREEQDDDTTERNIDDE